MSKQCEKIAGLQDKAKEHAEIVSTTLEDPGKLIETLRNQVKTVTSLQRCVEDLSKNKEGLTAPVLDQLKEAFKELTDVTEQNHQKATRTGIRLTPKVHNLRTGSKVAYPAK